jgi:ADP-ribosyltransferase exoenzyme
MTAPLDLAYDPHQPRGDDGRWIKDPTAAQWAAIDARDLTGGERDRGNASLSRFNPVQLPSDTDAASYLRSTAPHLPAAQRDAVTRYTGDEFYRLNRALRSGDASDPEVRRLDAAMRPAPDDMILARHVDISPEQAWSMAGKKISDKAYASAVLGSPYAGGLGGLTLHIAVPKGTPVINAAALSSNPHEREVILGRGTSMAVARVVPNGRYGYDAYAVVIPPASPPAVGLASPSPPQQPVPAGQQVPPPQQPDAGQDIALTVAISELLLTAASVAVMMAALKLRFKLSAELWQGIAGAAGVAMTQPPPTTGVVGAASAQTSRQNLIRRAQFVLSAGKRLAQDIRQARAQGKPVTQAVQDGLARERRYYQAHTAAIWNRAVAAGKTDMAAMEHGDLLGWLSVMDRKTSAECRRASGQNYHASQMPDIGYPGSVHPACRCMAVAPWPGGRLLPSRGASYARAA